MHHLTYHMTYDRHKRSEKILRRKAEEYERVLRGDEELPGASCVSFWGG